MKVSLCIPTFVLWAKWDESWIFLTITCPNIKSMLGAFCGYFPPNEIIGSLEFLISSQYPEEF